MLANPWFRKLLSTFLAAAFTFSIGDAAAQDLPKEIRGYKVKKAGITITNLPAGVDDGIRDAKVVIGDPELVDISLSGITFEVSAELEPLENSGKVDFLTFHDIRINGITVNVGEYKEAFNFKKGQRVKLPNPARVFLRNDRMMRATWKEFRENKDDWTVTGRMFVFGRFRKFGIDFKRVVLVDINFRIKNPLLPAETAGKPAMSQTSTPLMILPELS